MARYATYIRASTDDQETSHQRDAIDKWLSQHEVDSSEVDRYVDLAQSGADPGREQFTELVDAIQSESYEYVVVWEISRLARLGSISQRFFEHCEDAGTTVAITDGWVEEVRPDGTGKLIADISAPSLRRNDVASPNGSSPASRARNVKASGSAESRRVFAATTTGISS
jgi:DNA invertase Pin-like site-specific DNA recombinase